MKSHLLIFTLAIFALLTLGRCTSPNAKQPDKKELANTVASIQIQDTAAGFPLPDVPIMITNSDERILYLSKHFWDLFPFADTTLISQPDITEQGFVDYIQLLNQIPYSSAQQSLLSILDKAKVNKTMYAYFATLFEKYFYDPNSPFRNDELYIPVVENLLKSGLLSGIDQQRYAFQQEMVLKNRIGTKATDFVYTLANGDKKNMHNLKSNYLILFFSNPDCPTCAAVTNEINSSSALHNLFTLNTPNSHLLTVLSIYPDSNVDQWRRALSHMPQANWVNSYDAGTQIINKRLYDIKAIPTMYLLDRNKQIILKDTSLEEIEVYFMKVR